MRGTRLVVLSVALAVAAGGGAAYVATRPAAHRPAGSASAPFTPRPDVLEGLPAGSPPAAATVRRELRAGVRAAAFGGSLAGVVVDAATGQRLWGRAATTAMPPASTVKLMTAAAALEALGPTTRLSTGVVRSGRVLYLVGDGDVTLTARGGGGGYPPVATLRTLARRTAAAVAPLTVVRLRYDTSAWHGPSGAPGWNPGYFTAGDVSRLSPLEVDEGRVRRGVSERVADPAMHAAEAFAESLREFGVRVVGAPRREAAPASGLGVAQVQSAELSALVQRMLTVSDNDLAESLGRLVARRLGEPATFAGAAAAITEQLRRLGVPMRGIRLYDASGLSRLDRVTPRALVTVLRIVERAGATFDAIGEGLPVAGFTGTLADRYRGPARSVGAGVVRAKTGTLAGVSGLAGQVVDASGRLLLFAFLTDHAPSPTAAEAALDRLAARLAG